MYTMKEVCEKLDMTYETLKYYCNEGLVPNVKRDKNNHRIFDENTVNWISSLSCLKKCGMSIQDMKKYLADSGCPEMVREDVEVLSVQDCMEEFMFLGLRMNEGISEKQFEELFGQRINEVYGEVLKKYLALDLLWRSNGRIGLTGEGISISNVILSDFLLG